MSIPCPYVSESSCSRIALKLQVLHLRGRTSFPLGMAPLAPGIVRWSLESALAPLLHHACSCPLHIPPLRFLLVGPQPFPAQARSLLPWATASHQSPYAPAPPGRQGAFLRCSLGSVIPWSKPRGHCLQTESLLLGAVHEASLVAQSPASSHIPPCSWLPSTPDSQLHWAFAHTRPRTWNPLPASSHSPAWPGPTHPYRLCSVFPDLPQPHSPLLQAPRLLCLCL